MKAEVSKRLSELRDALLLAESALDDPDRPMQLPPCPGAHRWPEVLVEQPMHWMVIYKDGEFASCASGSFGDSKVLDELAAR